MYTNQGVLNLCLLVAMSGEEEITGMNASGTEFGQEIDWSSSALPGYLAYLSLMFKLITTLMTFLMASWVITTIKKTRHLHKPHNIFVANLMVADIMTTVMFCSISTTMVIADAFGVGGYISCHLLRFPFTSGNVVYYSFLVISVDTVIAIAFPLKHKRMLTRSAIRSILIAEWIVSITPLVPLLFHTAKAYINVAKYGTCTVVGAAATEVFFTHSLPGIITTSLSIVLNAYASIKAYQAYKRTEAENRLSGNSGQSTTSDTKKQQQHRLKKQVKPIITMLVIASGGVVYCFVAILLFYLGRSMISSSAYHNFLDLIIITNSYFAIPLLHPFVYGLYFKQVREPMLQSLKSLCCKYKFNSAAVTPQMPRTAWM